MSARIQQLRATALLAAAIVATAAASQASRDGAAAWAQAVRSSRIDAATAARVERLIAGTVARVAVHTADGQPPIEIVAIAQPADRTSASSAEAAQPTFDRLSTWLGPLPGDRLTIVDVPAHARLAGAAYPGIAMTSSRWLTTRREFAAERALTASIARQYALALAGSPPKDSWFAEGMAAYFATRAVHETFEGRYYLTLRYFGGYVPHSLRAVLVSPNPLDPRPRVTDLPDAPKADEPWRLAHGAGLDRAHRLTMALHTLERFVGWPAFQAALRVFVEQNAGRNPGVPELAAVLSQQRGADMTWFFDQAMRMDAHFDYAVVNLSSVPAAAAAWETTVEVRRLGDAVFAGTSQARESMTARSLAVVVRFSDGSEITEWIDGRDREWRFEYSSKSRADLASVDPGAILLLDADRTNNTRTLDAPLHTLGLRLALNWLAWLQDAMLASTAVV